MQATSYYLHRQPLLAAALFASTDDTRFVLNGVRVEIKKDAITYVGTDGRTLFACRVDNDDLSTEEFEFTIPTCLLKGLGRSKMDKIEVQFIKGQFKNFVTVFNGGLGMSREEVPGKFPNWRHVSPTKEIKPTYCPTFNPMYADRIYKEQVILKGKKNPSSLSFYSGDGSNQEVMIAHFLAPSWDCICYVMPVRDISGVLANVPDWALPPKKEEGK